MPLRLVGLAKSNTLGPTLLKLGVSLSLVLITLPAGIWLGIRILQVIGFAG